MPRLAGVGEVGGAVQQGVRLVVEGAADVEGDGAVGKPEPGGGVDGHGRGCEDPATPRPQILSEDPVNQQGRGAQAGILGRSVDPHHLVVRCPAEEADVVEQ